MKYTCVMRDVQGKGARHRIKHIKAIAIEITTAGTMVLKGCAEPSVSCRIFQYQAILYSKAPHFCKKRRANRRLDANVPLAFRGGKATMSLSSCRLSYKTK
jgi:hypothetical protein